MSSALLSTLRVLTKTMGEPFFIPCEGSVSETREPCQSFPFRAATEWLLPHAGNLHPVAGTRFRG